MKYLNYLMLVLAVALSSALSSLNAQTVVIDKKQLTLTVIDDKNDTIFAAPVCVGKNFGDKQRRGDMRTPEGNFSISQIQDASAWTHDFKDGAGERKGAYGPYFMRLKMPRWTSIGIHGTCFPNSIGTRDSEGCVRLLNEDLVKLHQLVKVGTKVTILPD